MVGALTLVLAAALAGSYDCTLERQVVIAETGASNSEVQFPESERDAWRFRVRVPNGDALSVNVDWSADPIQIAGTHRTLAVAPGQVAFAAANAGPCMFTEQACLSLVELSAREDGSAAVSILPAGSVRNEDGTRGLLHVAFLGTCRKNEAERR